MKPFLKWAGNKYRIIENIKAVLPPGKRLIEPFAGSGAVFLNTDYSKYLIAEINPDLINLYQQLQQEGQSFIDYVATFFVEENNQAESYYKWRECFNTTTDCRLKSALFIYLNKACFNGLCRYNSKGIFNVPFGSFKKLCCPTESLNNFLQKSTAAKFIVNDFKKTLAQVKKGDVVYCDPPYVPLSKTANFTKYSQQDFAMEQQQTLADEAERLQAKGITVVISNHDTPEVREMYHRAVLHELSVARLISRNADKRHNAREILAVFEPRT